MSFCIINYLILHVFGALCYPTNNSENLGKLQPKADIGIFIGYAPTKKAFRIYNKRTRQIVETIHVDFDELTTMDSEQSSSGPALNEMTLATISSGLVQKPSSLTPYTTPETQSPVIPQDVEEDIHDIEVAHIGNDSLFGVPIPEVTSAQSSSTVSPHTIPNAFVDQDNPNHVYKLKKALYELKQALRAWYDMLSSFLISQDFSKSLAYPSLFIRRNGNDLLLKSKLDEDREGKAVDPSHYRGIIGTLYYLTASRPDLQFAICMCARYQARPIEKHIHVVKRIFRYLCGIVNWGLWYPKDSSVALTAFVDADHAGCQDTCRSTSGSL
nr:retrovirus-related Pol polyprotein from transposon TNT 1-94 [Tanacetum cinerariifolium]